MEDLMCMAVFARVVEAKSFSGAARRLNLSRSQVSKQVAKP
jgi:DNA-binding transcriptional LysR family regulator